MTTKAKFIPFEDEQPKKAKFIPIEDEQPRKAKFIPMEEVEAQQPLMGSIKVPSYKDREDKLALDTSVDIPSTDGIQPGTGAARFTPMSDEDLAPSLAKPLDSEKDKFSKMGNLMKTLDILGRPGYAFKSVISDFQKQIHDAIPEGKKGNIIEITKALYKRKKDFKRRLDAAYRGLSGKERVRIKTILSDLGVPVESTVTIPIPKVRVFPKLKEGISSILRGDDFNTVMKPVVPEDERPDKSLTIRPSAVSEFILEVYTDPLLWVGGYSLITKGITKSVKLVGKGITKAPGAPKALAKVGEVIAPAVAKFKKMFVEKSSIPELATKIDDYLSAQDYMKGQKIEWAVKVRNVIQRTADKTRQSIDDVERQIRMLIENPNSVPKAVTEVKVMARVMRTNLDNILLNEMRSGVATKGLGTAVQIEKSVIKHKLAVLKVAKKDVLVKAKGELVSKLDDMQRAGLKKELTSLKKGVVTENTKELKKLIIENKSVDKQIKIYERQIALRSSKKLAAKDIAKKMDKLENDYWYNEGEIADRLQDIPGLAKGEYINRVKEIETLLKKSNIDVDLGKIGAGVRDKIFKLEKSIKASDIEALKGARPGKLLKRLAEIRATSEMGYFPRIPKEQMSSFIKSAKLWNKDIGSSIKRKTSDYTFEEANKFLSERGMSELAGEPIKSFFMEHPASAVALRGIKSVKAVSSSQFIDDVGRTFGRPERKAPEFFVSLPESITKKSPLLKGLKFDPDIVDEITRVTEHYINPKEAGVFTKTWDAYQNYWKVWHLAPFPKYHIRNIVGNLWNNHLAGVSIEAYGKAQALQAYRKYGKTAITKKNLKLFGMTTDKADDLVMEFEKRGVFSKGQYGADIETSIAKSVAGEKSIIQSGLATGRTFENNARVAHAIHFLDKGKSFSYAAMSTKKFLFDYSNLTQFEREIMKRFFPFYTFTRKNLPLQLEMLWTKPEKFAPLFHPLRNRDPKDLLRMKYVNKSLYNRLPIEMQRTVDDVTYVPLEGLLPAADISKLFGFDELFFEMLFPPIKAPFELFLGKKVFGAKDLKKYSGETQEVLTMDVPVTLKHALLSTLPWSRVITTLDGLIKKKTYGAELTAGEEAFSNTLGSVYKISLNELRSRAKSSIRKSKDELVRGLKWARKNDRPAEEKRIRLELEKIKKEYKDVGED